jgi:hypothetical protein
MLNLYGREYSMDYEKLYEEAKASGTARRVSPEKITFAKGSKVIGKYISRQLIKSSKEGLPDFYIYTFDTNMGPVCFPISGAYDKDTGGKLQEGALYVLENKGTRQISGNRKFKDVLTTVFPPKKEDDENDDDEEEEEEA